MVTYPVYQLQDFEAIEAEAAALVTDATGLPCAIHGPRADNPRTGASGTDVGELREIVVAVGEDHVSFGYFGDLAACYEWEGRGEYSGHLAREIVRRWTRDVARLRGAGQPAANAADGDDGHVHVETDDGISEMEDAA